MTVKQGNTLTVCILTFQLNQGMCILGYVQMNSTHSGHFSLFILLVDYTPSLQLAIEDVFEARVHDFIYGHMRS